MEDVDKNEILEKINAFTSVYKKHIANLFNIESKDLLYDSNLYLDDDNEFIMLGVCISIRTNE